VVVHAQAAASEGWITAGANPQRTSWVPDAALGALKPMWVKPVEPYISQKVQIIAASGKLFVSTARGLYAFDAATGADLWVYPTELPLGHSPTYQLFASKHKFVHIYISSKCGKGSFLPEPTFEP